MTRSIGAVLAALALLCLPAATAAASPVSHDSFGPDTTVFAAGEICPGFAVTLTVSGKVTYHEYANGDFRFNVDYTDVYTSNGRRVTDKEPNNVLIRADGTVTITGNIWHFKSVAPGNLELDAGRITYDANGTVIFEAGRHPVIDRQQAGGTVFSGPLCGALAP
jgi:hypothetical protein